MESQKSYLMSDGQDYTKIGKSVDPNRRESELKTANPAIELLAICEKDVEDELHGKYSSFRYKGEWFKLNSKQILQIISDYEFKSIVEEIKTIEKESNSDKEINPFSKDLTVETGRKIIDYHKYNKNREIYDNNKNVPLMYLERGDKVSLFTSPIIRHVLCKLSGSATKLLVWILQSMIYGEDIVKFNTKRFLKETKMSPTTLNIAKKELISNQIIALKKDNKKHLWINPAIMFKGNRAKKYPNNIIAPIGSNITSDSKIN